MASTKPAKAVRASLVNSKNNETNNNPAHGNFHCPLNSPPIASIALSPAYRPTLFQYGQIGKGSLTVLIQPGAKLPDYPQALNKPPVLADAPKSKGKKNPPVQEPDSPQAEKAEKTGDDPAAMPAALPVEDGKSPRKLLIASTAPSAAVA